MIPVHVVALQMPAQAAPQGPQMRPLAPDGVKQAIFGHGHQQKKQAAAPEAPAPLVAPDKQEPVAVEVIRAQHRALAHRN